LHPFSNPGRTKLSLVSRGLALPNGLADASRWLSQANGTETLLDLRLSSGHFCTVPVGQPYTEASGFSLQLGDDGQAVLSCGGELETVTLLEAPRFYQQLTRRGARMGSFASLHDRLLILQPFMGCGFFAQQHQACAYCQFDSMMNDVSPALRDPLELVEVVLAALAEREVDTVYLYHGFSAGDDAGLLSLVPVVALLRRHLGHRQIALETIAPRDVSVVDALYAAGLDVFICNLEVNDAERFADICPGKEKQGGQEAIWQTLEHAQRVFRAGAVVSHLIVGLEPLESTIQAMKALIKKGIVPLLVPFRPLPNTPLQDVPIPSLDDVEHALLMQYQLLEISGIPMHRLRDMGRVLTPMESRVLVGHEPAISERWAISSWGRYWSGQLDGLRRYLSLSDEDGVQYQRSFRHTLIKESLPFVSMFVLAGMFLLGVSSDVPDGLTQAAWSSLWVFFLCLVLWVTQLLPLAITSLLGLALLPLLGVLPATEVFALFGNPAVFFILGAFMLVAGVMQSGLSEHVALHVLNQVADKPKRLLMMMLLLPALMACVMPEHAVAALFLPIAWEIVRVLSLKKGHVYAQAIFFALAWGAIIGGVTTLLGGARGPLALALSSELTGQTFSFLTWTLAALPMVMLLLAVAAFLLQRMTRSVVLDLEQVQEYFEQRRLELGDLPIKSWLMGCLMVVTILAWLLAGHASSLASISLVAVVMMFVLRIVAWSDIESHVSWSVVLMYGGAIAIGKSLSDSGAAIWLAHTLIPGDMVGLGLLALLVLLTLFFTEGVSNAAAVAIVLPVAMPVASSAGFEPVSVALTVGLVSGFAFVLPMSTPPNAMIHATGYLRSLSMLRYGGILSVSAFVIFIWVANYWWPIVGIDLWKVQ